MRGSGDYVLGTHDEEVARLGLQHRAWRPLVLDAWRRAGFSPGDTLLDLPACLPRSRVPRFVPEFWTEGEVSTRMGGADEER